MSGATKNDSKVTDADKLKNIDKTKDVVLSEGDDKLKQVVVYHQGGRWANCKYVDKCSECNTYLLPNCTLCGKTSTSHYFGCSFGAGKLYHLCKCSMN